MNSQIENDPILKRIFIRIPSDMVDTFTSDQLKVLRNAFVQNPTRKHAIDIRLSIPLFRIYLVILSGQEKRSQERLKQDRVIYPLWTFFNILAICTVCLSAVSFLVGLLLLSYPASREHLLKGYSQELGLVTQIKII